MAFSGLLWIGGILLLTLMTVVVALYLRRQLRSSREDAGPPFTLEDLRRMRDAGEVTPDEFDVLKRSVIDRCIRPARADR